MFPEESFVAGQESDTEVDFRKAMEGQFGVYPGIVCHKGS